MTELSNSEIELRDDINGIVEETLEEAAVDANATDEEESIASIDKAAKATKKAPVPKTKAGMISAMTNKMLGMSKLDMQSMYASYNKNESVDMDNVDAIVETQIDTSAELDALVESEATLSDEFKQKTAVIFESALKTKLSEEVERIESAYEERLAEEIVAQRDELVEKVDSYLNYVVENWMEENRVAIQSGLRTEIAENFMESLKGLFVESYVDVPESKVDLVDDLAEQVGELEETLYNTTAQAIELGEQVEVLKRQAIISEAVHDLADTQVEKFETLVEDLDFEDEDSFAQKVSTIKESYFARTASGSTSTESLEESYGEEEVLREETTPSMDRYLSAIRKSNI